MSHLNARFSHASLTALVFSITLWLVPPAHAQTPVTQCGQIVDNGFLVADLDCSSLQIPALTLTHKGSLDLGGFTLTSAECSVT